MLGDDDNRDKQGQALRGLIASGAEIAGGAVGGALGFLAAGPLGAALLGAAGAVVATALQRIGEEVSGRFLGPRERVRLGGVLAIAAAEIDLRIKSGQNVRSDGFFQETPSGRSDGEEVAESVLLRSQREPEEKKLPYLAHLLASIPFEDEISAPMAHQIIRVAEQLTYRQLCILKLTVVKQKLGFGLRIGDYRGQGALAKELYPILYECLDLYHRGLVNFGGEVAFGPTDVAPGKMTVQGLGADLYSLMRLGQIPDEDLITTAVQLR